MNVSYPSAQHPASSRHLAGAGETPDVVVVGGGPAGLSAATALKQAGVTRVVLLERQSVAGGIPRHCGHSPFGMREFRRILSGQRYADRLVETAISVGVDLRLCHSVVSIEAGSRLTVASPDGLVSFAPRAIMLATGIREASRAGRLVSGARPAGILNTAALQDLVHLRRLAPFRRPLIVGTELVSMSAILTCLTAGARPAALVEAGPRTVVRAPFGWLPRVLRLPVFFDTEIVDIAGSRTVEAVTLAHRDGTIRTIACDGVLLTGCFTPESSLARASGIAIDPGSGGPVVDTAGRSSIAGIYAAGNLLRGVETAGHCWSEGRRVAHTVAADLASRGPILRSATPVEAGSGVKLVMPQRLAAASDPAFDVIQVRLDDWVKGELVVEREGKVIWRRRLQSGPERRVSIPVRALPADAGRPLRVVARNL